MPRFVSIFFVLVFLVCGVVFSAQAEKTLAPDEVVAAVEKKIGSMNRVMRVFLKEIAKAREKKDVRKLNCLLVKFNLVKGLVRASNRAKGVLMEASYGGDSKTAKIYRDKITAYYKSVREIEDSIDECTGVKAIEEGTTLIYIRPDAEELEPAEIGPWDWQAYDGAEGYPVVPPATPFR